jgi:hypothetical protein
MAMPEHHRTNFQTLLHAAMSGDLALMECVDTVSGEPRFVVCAAVGAGKSICSRRSGTCMRAIPSPPMCR